MRKHNLRKSANDVFSEMDSNPFVTMYAQSFIDHSKKKT